MYDYILKMAEEYEQESLKLDAKNRLNRYAIVYAKEKLGVDINEATIFCLNKNVFFAINEIINELEFLIDKKSEETLNPFDESA